jgi:MFS superfamily sulfate permease-like transporter
MSEILVSTGVAVLIVAGLLAFAVLAVAIGDCLESLERKHPKVIDYATVSVFLCGVFALVVFGVHRLIYGG